MLSDRLQSGYSVLLCETHWAMKGFISEMLSIVLCPELDGNDSCCELIYLVEK